MNIPPRFKHQDKSLQILRTRKRGYDASDPGTGKTRVYIDFIDELYSKYKGKTLIVAPKILLDSTWEEDFETFCPHIKPVIISTSRGLKDFSKPGHVYLISVDYVKKLATQPAKFFAGFTTLVIDEIGKYKHYTSARSKAIAKISKYFIYRFGLNGTPIGLNILDIWHQIFIIDDGERLGRSFTKFRRATCYPVQVGPAPNMQKWETLPNAVEAVSDLISDITIRHKFEDCIDIPENWTRTVFFEMPPAHRAAYEKLKKHSMLITSKQTITAVNAAVLSNRLLQLASGAVYADDGSFVTVDITRFMLAIELIEQREAVLVFFQWKHQKKIMGDLLKQNNISFDIIDGSVSDNARKNIVQSFQNGDKKVLLAHPQSAAHGLTLTRANTVIWLSPTTNLEFFLQGNRRIYRAGQTKKTETIELIAKQSADGIAQITRNNKKSQQDIMLSILQDKT